MTSWEFSLSVRPTTPANTQTADQGGRPPTPPKAHASDFLGRMREVVSDPLNLAIARHPLAGLVDEDGCVTLHPGTKVPLTGEQAYYDAFSALLVINRGVHEPLEEYAFQETLRGLPERPRMLELGAYWGHYSMWLKTVRPEAAVVLVEPDPARLEVGQANFARNGLQGEFVQANVAADGFTVDSFFETYDWPHLDVLHADIQGAEAVMLEGARRALAERRITRLFVSTHTEPLHGRVADQIAAAGYRIEVSSPFAEHTTAHDGFILASDPAAPPVLPEVRPLGRTDIAHADPARLVASARNALS